MSDVSKVLGRLGCHEAGADPTVRGWAAGLSPEALRSVPSLTRTGLVRTGFQGPSEDALDMRVSGDLDDMSGELPCFEDPRLWVVENISPKDDEALEAVAEFV